jgi:hypothetical protein
MRKRRVAIMIQPATAAAQPSLELADALSYIRWQGLPEATRLVEELTCGTIYRAAQRHASAHGLSL